MITVMKATPNYCYLRLYVLKNKLNVKDGAALNIAEREITAIKIAYLKVNPLKGKFDLKHLQAIHQHIFYDIYEWAGELRTVNIAKGNMFCKCQFITIYADSLFQ